MTAQNSSFSAGELRGDTHFLPLRVYYEDTDFSGIVYHANYLKFFERGRTEFIRALGVDQQALHRDEGIAFAVRAMGVEFVRPAMMDDIVEVQTKAGSVKGPSLHLVQAIRRGAEVLTTATVQVVCIKGGRPQRLPEVLRRVLVSSRSADILSAS